MVKRRFDPRRRERIIDAALDVIAEHGVAGVTHRRVAARADVPLGSMTYHFAGMEDLLYQSFARFSDGMAKSSESRWMHVAGVQQARKAIEDMIHDETRSLRELVLTHELYTLAARNPAYRAITHAWMQRSREVLARFFDAATCRMLDAFIEGALLHLTLDIEHHDRALTSEAVARITTDNRETCRRRSSSR